MLLEYPRKRSQRGNLQENSLLIETNVWLFYYQIGNKAYSLTLYFRNISPIRNIRVTFIKVSIGLLRYLYISSLCSDMVPSQGSKVLDLEQVGLRWALGGSPGDRDMVPSSVYVLYQFCVHKQPTTGRHVHAFHWWIPGTYNREKAC